jgi:hypothetical protein
MLKILKNMISLQTATFENGSHMDTYDSLIIGGRIINISPPSNPYAHREGSI